jgi:hypothetical protein
MRGQRVLYGATTLQEILLTRQLNNPCQGVDQSRAVIAVATVAQQPRQQRAAEVATPARGSACAIRA